MTVIFRARCRDTVRGERPATAYGHRAQMDRPCRNGHADLFVAPGSRQTGMVYHIYIVLLFLNDVRPYSSFHLMFGTLCFVYVFVSVWCNAVCQTWIWTMYMVNTEKLPFRWVKMKFITESLGGMRTLFSSMRKHPGGVRSRIASAGPISGCADESRVCTYYVT